MDTTIAAPTLIASAVALFAICNPIGTLPVFLQVTAGRTPAQQRRIGLLVGLAVIVILAVSLIAGTWVLQIFGIHITARVLTTPVHQVSAPAGPPRTPRRDRTGA